MDTGKYYTSSLSGKRLEKCYKIAPERTGQYLDAELDYVLSKIQPDDQVIELGCGYGRVLPALGRKSKLVLGIDTSYDSLSLAKQECSSQRNVHLAQMNAGSLALERGVFDVVVCIQNGISAFKLNPKELIMESIRVAKEGGICLFSSYSEKFWQPRLEWFILQAREGLIGEIDWQKTRDGKIVCKDGFTASTFSPDDLRELANELDVAASVHEVDDSSVFLTIHLG